MLGVLFVFVALFAPEGLFARLAPNLIRLVRQLLVPWFTAPPVL
jgi:hypothetical protein